MISSAAHLILSALQLLSSADTPPLQVITRHDGASLHIDRAGPHTLRLWHMHSGTASVIGRARTAHWRSDLTSALLHLACASADQTLEHILNCLPQAELSATRLQRLRGAMDFGQAISTEPLIITDPDHHVIVLPDTRSVLIHSPRGWEHTRVPTIPAAICAGGRSVA